MLSKVKTSILILIIILTALFWAVQPTQEMKRESDPVKAVAIAQVEEVRVILVGRGW